MCSILTKNSILLFALLVSTHGLSHDDSFSWSNVVAYSAVGKEKHVLTQEALYAMVAEDVAIEFSENMGIVEVDFKSMSYGNAELEKDLRNLYQFKSEEWTQAQLDIFCKKWGLSTITIQEVKKKLSHFLDSEHS